jgi:hypothetical protein
VGGSHSGKRKSAGLRERQALQMQLMPSKENRRPPGQGILHVFDFDFVFRFKIYDSNNIRPIPAIISGAKNQSDLFLNTL